MSFVYDFIFQLVRGIKCTLISPTVMSNQETMKRKIKELICDHLRVEMGCVRR